MNDLLPPDPDPAPPTPPTPTPGRATRITCDFCGCSLAPSGDVLRMSEEAKAFRDGADEIERLQAVISTLESQVSTLTRERDEARAALPKPRQGLFS
jgi:hypothetical protein